MSKIPIVLILSALMLLSHLAVASGSGIAGNHAYGPMAPKASPGITETGNVYIYANGSVSNASVVQEAGTTNTYNLLTNVNGSLFVDRNNTVLNGNGLTLNSGSSPSHGAFTSDHTTGVVANNLAISGNSPYGVELSYASNAVVNGITTVNFTGSVLVGITQSQNITIENGNFSLENAIFGVRAGFDGSITLLNNRFTGTAISFFYASSIGDLSAVNNTINTPDKAGNGFFVYTSGQTFFASNTINGTYYAIQVENSGASTSIDNYVSNAIYAYYESQTTSFRSSNDSAVYDSTPVYIEYTGPVTIADANYSNFTGDIYFTQYSSLSLSDSMISGIHATNPLQLYEGGATTIKGDTITASATSSVEAIFAESISGPVNVANDHISAPNGYALYLEDSPMFSLTGSSVNASYGVYMHNYTVSGAMIVNNYMYINNGLYGAMLTGNSTISNVNFSNNAVNSPNSQPAYSGIMIDASSSTTNNITVSGNSFLNDQHPILLGASYQGINLRIEGNRIVNSTTAIEDHNYLNSVISSNTIINTSYGILDYVDGTNATVSNNLIENMPGYGPMSYGIYVKNTLGGTNTISSNTVLNADPSGEGIYLYDSYGTTFVYSNAVTNSTTGIDIEQSSNVMAFSNTVTNASGTGIKSESNGYMSYYSNTVVDAGTAFYSYTDYGIHIYANTFYDAQKNDSSLHFLSLHRYQSITFYHNNFINNTKNSTTSNTFNTPYGSLYMNETLPVGGNYYSDYTGTGSNGIGSTPMNVTGSVKDFYPLLKEWTSPTVTFVEHGLLSGTNWSVNIGGTMMSSSSSGVVFQQTNGQYSTEAYTVLNVPGYTASTSSGTLSLNSASQVVTIDFSPVTYAVTFSEAGLAHGTSWSMTLNGNTKSSSGSSITFNVANGSYNYTVGAVSGYTSGIAQGTVIVDGAGSSPTVTFAQKDYILTVKQTGLPSGDSWIVSIAGKNYSSNTSTLTVDIPTGTYNITVSTTGTYTVTQSSGNLTIGASNQTYMVTFSPNGGNGKSSGIGTALLYGGMGGAAVVGIAVGAVATMFSSGTGIFRKRKGP